MRTPNYCAPNFRGQAFHCPYCGTYSKIHWETMCRHSTQVIALDYYVAHGECCHMLMFWKPTPDAYGREITGVMIYPASRPHPLPNPDMPEDVKADYLEAREVAHASPRAAAALLRLGIEKLCKRLGGEGKSINADIGALVKKGLPVEVQQALDVVRVVGNNAVHPGELSVDDVAAVSDSLFGLVNFIVENQITQRNAIKSMFTALPEGAQAAVAKRDGSTPNSS